jgi:phosphoglycerol transferase MdoB-like AlkP superfamily enzyme
MKSVDFGMISNNIGLLSSEKSWAVLSDTIDSKDLIEICSWMLLPWVFLNWNIKKILKFKFEIHQEQKPILVWGLSLIFTVAPAIVGYKSINKQTELMQSMWSYFFPQPIPFSPTENEKKKIEKTSLEFISQNKDKMNHTKVNNIFLIFLESFNAGFVEKQGPSGKPYTPYFNELIKKGVYFENFYANSMQTSKGQFATLCSQIPHSTLKEMVKLPELKIACLPQLLKEEGFRTIFIQGLGDLAFDNTEGFFKSHGYDEVLSMNKSFATTEELKYSWGMGVQDNILFKKSLEYRQQLKNKKVFLTVATISNHLHFKGIPDKLKNIYPHASDSAPAKERYANSVNVMDMFLKEFFDGLEKSGLKNDSLVVLLGDHGYPMGEHFNYNNENLFYNENFKTPLLIIAPFLKPQRISLNRSQIDIAPSLLSLLGGAKKKWLKGEDLFDQKDHIVPLIQPYDGRYVSIIKGEEKYVFHFSKKEKYLFNLKNDPKELVNLHDESKDKTYFPLLKNILLNDYFLETNNQK